MSLPLQKSPTRTPGRSLARPRRRSRGEPEETALRLRPDGSQEVIPLTREILINPCPEIQILHSDDHFQGLDGLIGRLRRFVERRPGWRLFSDVSISWPMLSRGISPDVSVAENVPARQLGQPRKTLDVAKEGCRVRAVFEVVSQGPKSRWKDEDHNPPRFARAGVDDLVLIYLPNLRKPEDPPLKVFSLHGGSYRERLAGADGRYLLASIGVSLAVEGEGLGEEVVAYDAATGKRLRNVEEEEAKRRQAERRAREQAAAREAAERQARDAERQAREQAAAREAAERQARDAERRTLCATLLRQLGNRGLAMSEHARELIESCPDSRKLEHWLDQVFFVDSVEDLWKT